MKRQVFSAIMVLIILPLSIFANVCSTGLFSNIQTHGTINYGPPLTVILRGQLPSQNQNLSLWVKNFVGNYTFGSNMVEVVGDLHISGILMYPQQFNSTYGTWPSSGDQPGYTWNQLKTLIDAFHSYGWKVVWGGTNVAWENQWVYNYITEQHPELAFCDANGYRANDIDGGPPSGNTPGNKTVGYNNLIPNLWANYTTPGDTLGIANNTRLLDVLCTKLGQMISDGLQFDGWFPSDGWNGFNFQGYTFSSGWGKSGTYSFGPQELAEWAQDTSSGFGLPSIGQPSNWDSWNITQKADWIYNNSTAFARWYDWWCYRFSKAYLQIKNTIETNNPGQPFYTMIQSDGRCTWAGYKLLNFTMVADDGSIDLFLTSAENNNFPVGEKYKHVPQQQAWVASLIKGKDVRLNSPIGIIPSSWYDGNFPIPLGYMKQQYLAQVQSYVWFNGTRYRACNTSIIFFDASPDGSNCNINKTANSLLFSWINSVHNIFQNAQPVYLGPTLVDGYSYDGWVGPSAVEGINYTFAQWVDALRLQESTSYINSSMGTLLLECTYFSKQLLQAQQDLIDALFANKSLNVIITNGGGAKYIKDIFVSGDESKVASTFCLSYSSGSTNQYAHVLDQGSITDAIGKWIASGYDSSNSWKMSQTSWAYCYQNLSGFIPIAMSDDNRTSLGIFYNSTSANFLYMQGYCWPGTGGENHMGITIPREIVNRAIYWASNSPINASESLLDYKVFNKADGTIFIPMMNHASANGQPLSATLNINAAALGLGSISNYNIYWQSNPSTLLSASNWNNLPITLSGMADVLVIAPK